MSRGGSQTRVPAVSITFGIVLATALLGIWSRSGLPLASFWPANAVLLGLLLRHPRLASVGGWIGAVGGYLAADLLTGGELLRTTWLTAANLAGVAVGYLLLSRTSVASSRLRSSGSILTLLGGASVAAAGATVPGVYCGTRYFDLSVGSSIQIWMCSELASFLTILPLLLAMPAWDQTTAALRGYRRPGYVRRGTALAAVAPWLVLVAFLVAAPFVGGPAALALPLPAILWGALQGSVFRTAALLFVANGSVLLLLGFGHLDLSIGGGGLDYETFSYDVKVSLQLGLSLLAVGPLMVAASTSERDSAYRRLVHESERDVLTGLLTRRAFFERASLLLAETSGGGHPAALLMLDLDRFKAVNDERGHQGGDRLLEAFAAAVTTHVRALDPVGRLGGEEFAVLLPGAGAPQAAGLAEAIRSSVAALEVDLDDGRAPLRPTVSIGVATTTGGVDLEGLLALADGALYEAKRGGRDAVVVATP